MRIWSQNPHGMAPSLQSSLGICVQCDSVIAVCSVLASDGLFGGHFQSLAIDDCSKFIRGTPRSELRSKLYVKAKFTDFYLQSLEIEL